MPFSNYGDLKTAITDWMDRTDITGNADDFVTLAEAGLNRELEALEVDTTLTGVVSSRSIDLSSYGVRDVVSLFMTDQGREWQLLKLSDGDFPYTETAGKPETWAMDQDTINFECPLNAAYTFRLRHTVKFDLEDDADTNWLLNNHPDVYLSAAIAWGAKFVADDATLQRFAAPIDAFIRSVNRQESRRNKGRLTVDPALANHRRTHWGYYR